MRLRLLVPAVLAAALVGCVSVNKSILNRSHITQPLPRDSVQVFFASDSLPQHERIAILTAKGDENFASEAKIIDKLREEAGKLGANAIVLNELKDPNTGTRVASAVLGIPANRKGVAVAIFAPSLMRKP